MKKLSRRQFVKLSTVAVAGVMTSCASPPTVATDVTAPSPAPSSPAPAVAVPSTSAPAAAQSSGAAVSTAYREAPMLAALVQEGKLPPVSERLPKNPWVVPVNEGVGKYGGALRQGYRGTTEELVGWFMQEDLLFYDKDLTLKPDICESFEVNDAATEFTFKLREGMKWSDGHPLTADDYVWFHEYYAADEELSPGGMSAYRTDSPEGKSELATCEALDPYTFKYTFAQPKALFPYSVARFRSATMPSSVLPRHYMAQFHKRATDDQATLEAMVKEAQLEGWTALFLNKANAYLNAELPTLSAWQPVAAMPQQTFVLRRNPYFHGVDSAGQQLPYLDEHQYRYYDQPDTHNLWLLSGEIDLAPVGNLDTAALIKEREAQIGMTFLRWADTPVYAVHLNHSTKDDRLRELYSKRDFRLALMHAVNRDEMNNLLFDGTGTVMQAAPIPASVHHNPEASFSHIEYKPDYANELLDGLGLTERNAEGYRVWPDGKAVGFIILQTDKPTDVKIQETAIQYWKDVGIQVTLNIVQRNQYFADTQTNNCEAGGWSFGRTYSVWNDPGEYLGSTLERPTWPGWALWQANPDDPNAVEPPEGHFVRELWDIWSKCEVEADTTKRNQLFQQFLAVWAREVPTIGFLNAPAAWVAKNQALRGLPTDAVLNWSTGYIAQYMAQQYWWEDPEKHT